MQPFTATPTSMVKFHFSLWVADLRRTVAFYQALFGLGPAKDYPDYVKFEVAQPPIVLSFLRQAAPRGATLDHLGLTFPTLNELVAVHRRLANHGYAVTSFADGLAVVVDPDGVSWELRSHDDGFAHAGTIRRHTHTTPVSVALTTGDIWSHNIADPFPDQLPFADGSLSEVHLPGIFGAAMGAQELCRRLAEVWRVLKPNGWVRSRCLAGSRPYPGEPDFPGLMARIKRVPLIHEPFDELRQAGFVDIQADKLNAVSCVEDPHGIGFQLLVVSGRRPAMGEDVIAAVRYDGPFAQITDDTGLVFRRGMIVRVPPSVAERIHAGSQAGQFTFFDDKLSSPNAK